MNAPTIKEARNVLESTHHRRNTRAAAIHHLESQSLSIREAARRHGVNASNVLRALRQVPGISTARKSSARDEGLEAL